MGQVQSGLGGSGYGIISVTYARIVIRNLQATSDVMVYWTIAFQEESSALEEAMVGVFAPLRMAGKRLYHLQGRFAAEKIVSHDGKAVGLCLGGFRQLLEGIKKPGSHVSDVLYLTFEFKIKLTF